MIVDSDFVAAPYLRNAHLQTLFAAKARRMPPLTAVNERLELPDGDFLDLAWLPDADQPADTPVVIVLHGLTGSIESKYARGLLREIEAIGWRGVLMHFRGASGEPNRLLRSYHSGETGDLRYLADVLRSRYSSAPIGAVGYSLGGNVLLKYLGEEGASAALDTGVAVSVPFDLEVCARAINRGLSRAYQAHLITGMREAYLRKFRMVTPPFDVPDFRELTDFFSFDDALTAPVHGFEGALDYYRRCSSKRFVGAIERPTLILHAQDDPFMAPEVVPAPQALSASVRLELSERGGHVGFVAAGRLGEPVYWLERRIPRWLREQLAGEPEAEAGVAQYATE